MVQQSTAPGLDGVFHALADPTRRAIVAELATGEATVSQLASPFPMSLTAVSKHLRVLEEAGLVSRTRQGRALVCRLEPGPLAEAWEWIAHYQHFWEQRLETLDRLLDERRNPDG
jgi:DNA-binding transcriptional ArsR family regulator